MKLAVAVFGSPESGSLQNAAKFAEAALAEGHQVLSLFFYHEAVRFAWLSEMDAAVSKTIAGLRALGVPMHACVGASERRGLQTSNDPDALRPEFELVGLGQLISAILEADRFVSFTE